MSNHPLEEILHPKSIAVVGASDTGRGGGFLTPLQNSGYRGKIYPVNPKYSTIGGLPAYPRVSAIPGPVDYVISSIPAHQVMDLIEDCGQKGVKGLHLFTARFSETGRKDAADLEREILKRARKYGLRIIGPNCMGVYYPQEGIAFNDGMPSEPGKVGLISQSGQVVGEIVNFASQQGVRFSKAISYGNALDFNECDYLDYLAQDPETEIILLYIEGVRDGRRFPASLHKAASSKPVLIVKGGRGNAGTRATVSHTASLAGSQQVWEALVRQSGAVNVSNLEDLADLAVAFNFLPPATGRRLAVLGGSGGSSVLAADQCEEAGLDVIPFPQDIREKLKESGNPIWDWIGNPADFSISMGDHEAAFRIGRLMVEHPAFDVIMTFVHGPWRNQKKNISVEEHLLQYKFAIQSLKPKVFVYQEMRGHDKDDEESMKSRLAIKERLIEWKLAVYPTIDRAARALSDFIGYYENRKN
jgi:acyl-CoA synthetase (NDP forming)